MSDESRAQSRQPGSYYENEISLRELIEALLKHKIMIIIFTVAAILLGSLFTFVLITPVYEGRVIISMNRPDRYTSDDLLQELMAKRLSLAVISEQGIMNTQNAAVMINSPEVIEAAMKEAGFDSRPINRLMDTINVRALNPYLFQIAVQGTEQDQLLNLADEIAVQFNRVTINELSRSLQQEISRAERSIKSAEESLTTNRAQLEAMSPYITLDRSILDDPSMAIADPDVTSGTIIRSQEPNPSYLARLQMITEAEMLLNQQHIELSELQQESDQILELLNQPENLPVRVVRAAVEVTGTSPLRKVSPRTSLNLAIAFVLGLMMGVFAAFFTEYWKKSAPQADQ